VGIAKGQRRHRILHVGLLLTALAASGCGWRPLYERPSADPTSGGVQSVMARIAIDPVTPDLTSDPLTGSRRAVYDSRTAHQFQNRLQDRLNPYGHPSDPLYHLSVMLKQTTHGSVSLGNGEATREDLQMVARYELTDVKGTVLLKDAAQVITSYDVLQEPFSDLSASSDAMQRGVEQLALMIETRLAVFLQH
jgi:hypothetical protein